MFLHVGVFKVIKFYVGVLSTNECRASLRSAHNRRSSDHDSQCGPLSDNVARETARAMFYYAQNAKLQNLSYSMRIGKHIEISCELAP